MRVLTLDRQGLENHARQLERLVAGADGTHPCGGFTPDLIVGIATGGAILSRLMFGEVPHVEIVCRHVSSERRRNAARKLGILRRLPMWMLNIMRKVQLIIVGRKSNSRREVEPLEPQAREAVERARRILVVDDSVDSGITLGVVLDTLAAVAPEAEMRSAVMTVTLRDPKVFPTYCIYPRGVLIRAPWSNDARPSHA